MLMKESIEGKIIVFEGADGSGKSTQLELTRVWLEKRGYKVEVVRQPGYTWLGENLRAVMFGNKENEVNPLAMRFLFKANHADMVASIEQQKEVDTETIFLLDRYAPISNPMIGTIGDGVPVEQYATEEVKGAEPDLVLIYDATSDNCVDRLVSRGASNEYDKRDKAWFERVCKAYSEITSFQENYLYVLDGNYSAEKVFHLTVDRLIAKFGIVPIPVCAP